MNSATYQLSSTPEPANAADARFYSHYLVRRLPAEVILDAVSQVTGVPQEFPGYPKGTRALQLSDSQVASYFLTAFGRPERVQTCACERQQEPSIPQALHLSNGDTINQKLRAPGGTIDRFLAEGLSDDQVLEQLTLAALSRRPTEAERARVLPILAAPARAASLVPDASAAPAGTRPSPDDPGDKAALEARRQAIEDLFWATLTGKEFLFNH
jgi:hypothetical protein